MSHRVKNGSFHISNWNTLLTNAPNKVCVTTNLKLIAPQVELSKLTVEYKGISVKKGIDTKILTC